MSPWNVVQRAYQRLTRRREDARVQEAVATLAAASVFRGVPREALRALAGAVHQRTFRREEFLYYEDDPGLGLYVVQEGRVRLLVEDESGTLHELRQAGPGEAFGTLCMMGDFPRIETAQATAETKVLGLFRPDLKTMRRRHPQAAAAVVEALAEHLARRQVEVVRLVAEDGGRLYAKRLLKRAARRAAETGSPAPAAAAAATLPDERAPDAAD